MKLDEQTLFRALKVFTVISCGGLVLSQRFGWIAFYPLIRFMCKWSLFLWIFYGGVIVGKRKQNKEHGPMKENFKRLQDSLTESQEQIAQLKDELEKKRQFIEQEQKNFRKVETKLQDKIKTYERTGEEVNRLALKNFL